MACGASTRTSKPQCSASPGRRSGIWSVATLAEQSGGQVLEKTHAEEEPYWNMPGEGETISDNLTEQR